jgi:hypothetical protein
MVNKRIPPPEQLQFLFIPQLFPIYLIEAVDSSLSPYSSATFVDPSAGSGQA